jgi:hypothetical protein
MISVDSEYIIVITPPPYYILLVDCIEWRMSSSSKLSEFTQRAVSVYRECSLIAAATRARIFPRDEAGGCFEIEATWSQRELERGKKVSFTKSYFIQRKGQALEKLCNSTFQSDTTQVYEM